MINLALKEAGVALVSCTENIDDTPSGLLLHGIMSSIAEFYSRNLANEVVKGSLQKVKSGGTVGKAPTGYLNVRRMEQGREVRTVEIDPVRGPLMRRAFEAYATGDWTLRDLLAELTEQGLNSTPGPRTPSKPLALSHFHRLLRHPYYKGVVRYKGVEYPGKHTALVAPETWDRVQEVLCAHDTASDKQRDHPHYLKGSIFCGSCGSRLIVTITTNRWGTVYPYFVCLGRQQRRTSCTQAAVRIEVVERKVEEWYRRIQPTSACLGMLLDYILDELNNHRRHAEQEHGRQHRRRQDLLDQREKLLQAHYAGAIPLDLLKTEQQRIGTELATAEQRLAAAALQFDVIEANLHRALNLAKDWYAAYCSAPPAIRRQFNQSIFQKLTINEYYEIQSQFAEPFDQLLGHDVGLAAMQRARNAATTAEQLDTIEREWATISQAWAHADGSLVAAETSPNTNGGLSATQTRHSDGRGLKDDNLVDLAGQLTNPGFLLTDLTGPRGLNRPPVPQVRPRQAQRRLNSDEVALLVASYRQGNSVPRVAQQFGIHRTTVLDILEAAGVPRRANIPKLTGDRLNEAAELYEAGRSCAVIANELGVCAATVLHALRKAGVAIRARRGKSG